MLKRAANDHRRIYESLAMPIWPANGIRGEFSDVDAGRLERLANWKAQVFAAGGIPYFEQPEQFIAAYDMFHAQALSEHWASGLLSDKSPARVPKILPCG